MAEKFENILIIKPSSLGDIVMTLPALTALRNSFQNARISWLVRPEFAPLIEKHPHLNETILFDRNRFGTAWYNPLALASLMSLIRNLRRRDFDAVFDFQGLFRTASLAWLTGCKKRFGMKNAREFAYLFYTHTVDQPRDSLHVVDCCLKIVRAAGGSETNARFVVSVDPAAADSVNDLLAADGADVDSYAVLIPGAARPYKLWPLDRFAAVADKLASQFGLSIAATGAAQEKALIESLKSLTDVPITNLAGRTDLGQLTALLKNAKIVISNDTGPGHIAVALGTPLVMMFGRSNPIRLFPYGRPECTAAVEPFDRGNAINNYESKYDIKAVTVDDVFKKACKQIEHTPLTSK
ncbi:MAG: glycosyltransferase family 9 protein [Planctomycetota bacterium]|jgi:lipopolysaccharide heptosyltransferase I